MKTMDWLYRLCRWTLGVIFIYAGGTKLLEPEILAVLIEAQGSAQCFFGVGQRGKITITIITQID